MKRKHERLSWRGAVPSRKWRRHVTSQAALGVFWLADTARRAGELKHVVKAR